MNTLLTYTILTYHTMLYLHYKEKEFTMIRPKKRELGNITEYTYKVKYLCGCIKPVIVTYKLTEEQVKGMQSKLCPSCHLKKLME